MPETSQAPAEADGEDANSYPKPLGGSVMAKLVHQNHDAEDDGHGNHRNQERFHNPLFGELLMPSCRRRSRNGLCGARMLDAVASPAARISVHTQYLGYRSGNAGRR